MASSNNQLHDLAATLGSKRDPGFALIVAFAYYDGPERGLALYPSGTGVRFTSLGDSRSRLFRAFELTAIGGDWWRQVRAIPDASAIAPSVRVLVPGEPSEALALLEREVLDAPAIGHYIGVGSPNFDWLAVASLPEDQLDAVRQLGCSPAGFQSAHQILKRK